MIIIDDFIKDEDLLKKINESEDFWETGYRWYEGWWNEGINDLHHELIHAIWGPNSPHEGVQIEGFEHWVGDYTNKESHSVIGMDWSLKPHFDKDEDKWVDDRSFVTPKIGTVFYPDPEIDEMEGGMLYYWEKFPPQRANEDNTIFWPEEEPEIIKPKFNRLLIFDAGCLHGVSQIKSGRRRAVAINLWDQKPTTFKKDY